jgi:hypothetical protein
VEETKRFITLANGHQKAELPAIYQTGTLLVLIKEQAFPT